MRRKRNSRILLWPSLAASAVILVLLSTSHLQQQLGFGSARGEMAEDADQLLRNSVSTPRSASTLGPGPSGNAAFGYTHRWTNDVVVDQKPRPRDARPQDDRTDAVLRHVSVDVDTQQMLASTTNQPTPTTLLAPVRGDSEELAGLAELVRRLPTTRAASVVTNSEAVPDNSDRSMGNTTPPVIPPILVRPETYNDSDTPSFRISDGTDLEPLGSRRRMLNLITETLVTGLAWPRTPALDQTLSKISDRIVAAIPELRTRFDEVAKR